MNRRTLMGQMERVMDWSCLGDFLAGQRQARRAAARVHLQHPRLKAAGLSHPVFEPNGAGQQPMDNRPLTSQEQSCSFLGARHQRVLVSINDKDGHRQIILSVPGGTALRPW